MGILGPVVMASQEKNRILRYKKTIERITTGKIFFFYQFVHRPTVRRKHCKRMSRHVVKTGDYEHAASSFSAYASDEVRSGRCRE